MICATGVITALGVYFAGLMAMHLILASVYLFFLTVFTTYVGLRYPYYRYSLLIISFTVILAVCLTPSLSQNADRAITLLGGTAFIAFFYIFLRLIFYHRRLRTDTILALETLNLASREIFSCFVQPEYASNVYLFEKRLHLGKVKFMRRMQELQAVANVAHTKTYFSKIDELFNILIDCAQLRRRVSDHTVFALCVNELSAISLEIEKLFSEMILSVKTKLDRVDSILLAEKIKLFEDNFLNILRVTAREPLAFFLFIMSLKAFREAAGSF